MTPRRKLELALAAAGAMMLIVYACFVVAGVRADAALKRSQEAVDVMPPRPSAGELFGRSAGHAIGLMGRAYPTKDQIESLAKTSAVDAGSSPNDFVFTGAFTRAFAGGYAEGRRASR